MTKMVKYREKISEFPKTYMQMHIVYWSRLKNNCAVFLSMTLKSSLNFNGNCNSNSLSYTQFNILINANVSIEFGQK